MDHIRTLFHRAEHRFLLIILTVFSLLRLPSFFEPNWYGDEGIYQVLGKGIRSGRILYSQIWDNKPPLLYATYALVNADQFWIRFLSYLAGIVSVVIFFHLAKKLFQTAVPTYISTCIFALLFAIPTTEANIANAENFMVVFILSGGFIIYNSLLQTKKAFSLAVSLLAAGILLSIAFLYKIVAIFDFAAFFLFLTFASLSEKTKNVQRSIRRLTDTLLPYSLGFGAPIVITGIVFLLLGAFSPFLQATFSNNVSYVGYKNYFLIPQGLLIAKLLLLFGFNVFIFINRKNLSHTSMFVFLWFEFALFDSFFSQRPYTHYVLMSIAPLSYLIGLLFTRQNRVLTALCITLGGGLLFWTFSPIRIPKILSYYGNFISYVSGNKTTEQYYAAFDSDVPRDNMLAVFLKRQMKGEKNRTLFLWGNTAQIYTMSDTLPPGRYTVAYHINSPKALDETQNAIDEKKPRFVVLLPNNPTPQLDLTAYTYKATIEDALIYERTFQDVNR